jgi:hypothetical protein
MNAQKENDSNTEQDSPTPLSPWQEAVLRSADVFYVDSDGFLKREAPPTQKVRTQRNIEVKMHEEGSLN